MPRSVLLCRYISQLSIKGPSSCPYDVGGYALSGQLTVKLCTRLVDMVPKARQKPAFARRCGL